VAYRRAVAAASSRTARAAGTATGRRRTRGLLWRLTKETTAVCFRYRVTGLAAEAGFFALLSLPPLLLGLIGSIGYLGNWLGEDVVAEVQDKILELSAEVLTADSVREVIQPTLTQVFEDGRFDIISIGFLIALWSGSRALNVFIDTISIMYGLGGRRGIIRTRVLSFTLYVVAVVIGSVVVPLVLAGPSVLGRVLPEQVDFLNSLYWPVASLLSVVSLTSLYHISVPVRTPWKRDLPGALLTLLIWFGGSFVVRWIISVSVGGASIYGPLAAPIVLLIWLYVLAIAVLIGAALNAAVESIWPRREFTEAREAAHPVVQGQRRRRPGLDTGEIDLPPNRSPADNPLAPAADQR
jgi:membrane protein